MGRQKELRDFMQMNGREEEEFNVERNRRRRFDGFHENICFAHTIYR